MIQFLKRLCLKKIEWNKADISDEIREGFIWRTFTTIPEGIVVTIFLGTEEIPERIWPNFLTASDRITEGIMTKFPESIL